MAYICDNCGKTVTMGSQQSHARGVAGKRWRKRAQVTPRTFKPNLQKISAMIAGKKVRLILCTRCLKRFKKDGKLSKLPAVRIMAHVS